MRVPTLAFAISLVACPLLLAQQGEKPEEEPAVGTGFRNTAVGLGGGAGGIFGARGSGPLRSRLLGAPATQALQRGIAWLREHQRGNGAFGDDDDDVRATALAMLVMLADGSTMRSGPCKDSIKSASKWLREQLREDGTFVEAGQQASLETQAVAASALVEAFGLSSYRMVKADAQRAVSALAKPRDGELGQQVDREPHAAAWCVEAFGSAGFFQLEVDRPFAVATTERLGKLAAQKGAPAGATEAALRCAWSLAERGAPEHGEELAAKIAAAPPRADAIDFQRWLDGGHVMFQVGGRQWQAWEKALLAALLPAQADDGSWSAAKVGEGAIPHDASPQTCATARACLLLQVPVRFARRVR